MPQPHYLYVFADGDVMFYVGITRNIEHRMHRHRKDAVMTSYRVYKHIRNLERAGRPHRVDVIGEFPDRHTATIAEREWIAKVGLIEDGGTLLNAKRSSVRGDKAGYLPDALEHMSTKSKVWMDANREEWLAGQRERNQRPEYQEKQAEIAHRVWADPVLLERHRAKQLSPEVQAKRAAEMKRRWADPAFREKMAKRRSRWWRQQQEK